MFTELKECRVCKRPVVEVFDLGWQGIASTFPRKGEEDPVKVPLVLCKCENPACSLVQLKHTVESEKMYEGEYGYRSGINDTMMKHLKELSEDIERRVEFQSGESILDIGSNDATLLKCYSYGKDAKRIGIDPTGSQFSDYYGDDITLYPTYFGAGVMPGQAKIITSISMFYDLPDPVQFMRDIKKTLAPGGIWVMEQSYMPSMLFLNSYDTVCHEHLEYYTLTNIMFMTCMVGLRVVDVAMNACNGGSFRVYIRHVEDGDVNSNTIHTVIESEKRMRLESETLYEGFVTKSEESKDRLLSFLKEAKMGAKTVYIYGASTKGNTLLQYCGITNDLIVAAAERNPRKYGCRTPITNIPIVSEATMREAKPDYLLVLPWHFKEEFIEREQDFLDGGGSLVFPLPNFEIYTKVHNVSE